MPAGVLSGLPGDSQSAVLAARLAAVLGDDNTLVPLENPPRRIAGELRRLAGLLERLPAAVSVAPVFQSAATRIEGLVRQAETGLGSITNVEAVVDWLDAGTALVRVQDQLGYPTSTVWETDARLGRVVSRILELGRAGNAWTELHRAEAILLAAGGSMSSAPSGTGTGLPGSRLSRGARYAVEAAKVLAAEREVGLALWNGAVTAASRSTDSADVVLPGDIRVEKASGSVRYHRITREVQGSFGGQLRLPGLDLSLTVANASFSSGGAFDLNAYGSVVLPSAEDPIGRLSITPQHPLHIGFQAPDQLQLSGGAKVEINGMTFEGFLTLEDPHYAVGLSARGLRFDLANSIRLYVLEIPQNQVFEVPVARVLNASFRGINATLEGARGGLGGTASSGVALAGRPARAAGDFEPAFGAPPDFLPGFISTPLDGLDALANSILANGKLGIAKDYSIAVTNLHRKLNQVASFLRGAPPNRLSPAQLLVRLKVMSRLCEAYENLKASPNAGAYQALKGSGRLGEFVKETRDYVLRLLKTDDRRNAGQALEIVQAVRGSLGQVQCLLEEPDVASYLGDLDAVPAAFSAFLLYQADILFQQMGLRRGSGEPLGGWESIRQGGDLFLVTEFPDLSPRPGQPSLTDQLRDHTDPVSAYLWGRLTEPSRRLLSDAAATDDQRRAVLVEAFNRALESNDFYEPNRFARALLSDSTKAWTKKGVSPSERLRFHRTLLMEAFPGQVPGRLDYLSRDKLKEFTATFVTFFEYNQGLGLSDSSNYRGALASLSVRRREEIYKRILEIAPADQDLFHEKLRYLRHKLHRPPPSELTPPVVVELLDLYGELRELKNELFEIQQLAADTFDWPSGPIYQPYGANSPFEPGLERINATRAWFQAAFFASHADRHGEPLSYTTRNPVYVADTVSRLDKDNHPYTEYIRIRIDLIRLFGNDFDPRFQETRYAREAIAQEQKLKASVEAAAKARFDLAEQRLPNRRSLEQRIPIAEVVDDMIGVLTYARQNPLPDAEGNIDPIKVRTSLRDIINAAIGAVRGQGPILRSPAPAAAPDPSDWVPLSDLTERLLDAAEAPAFAGSAELTQEFRARASDLIRAAADVATQLQSWVPASRPVDLALPGDLVIDEVFGEIQYNRDTGQLSGSFGGRLEFPDNNASFEVSEATVDNEGRFSFKAALDTPLPVGGVRIKASLAASGRGRPNPDPTRPPNPADQEFALAGSGSLFLPRSGLVDQEFGCSVSYSTVSRILAFDSQARNLGIELGPQVGLFDAGFGFKLGGLGPDGIRIRHGELSFGGSAGLIRKNPAPVPDRVDARNYLLVARNIQTKAVFQGDRFELSLVGGTLQLPEMFTAGLCRSNATVSTQPGTIAILPDRPIAVSFGLVPAQGSAPSVIADVRFSGGLDLHDIGVRVPQLQGLAGEICDGTLRFPDVRIGDQTVTADAWPRIEIALGKIQIPLPHGQTSRLEVVNAAWSLDGFPSGTVRLTQDLRLLDQGGVTLTLLGATNTECFASDGVTPLGTGLTVFPGDSLQFPPILPNFRLDGGVRLALPLSALTTTNSPPDRVAGTACGSLMVSSDRPPDLTLGTLALAGTFHLGANGPVIQDARVSLEQLQNLFQLGGGREFIARVAGTLRIPQGPAFTLNNARLTFSEPLAPPRFALDGLAVNNRDFTLMQRLPVRVQEASFRFRDSTRPLDRLFLPDNVQIQVSADVSIPAPPSQPYFTGRVDDLQVEFTPEGIPQLRGIDGFGLGVGGIRMPPLEFGHFS